MSKRVVVSGRLVDTPEPVQLPDWGTVCFLRLRRDTGERPRPGESRAPASRALNVIVLGRHARRVAPYLYAGRRVVIYGRVESTRWEAGEGRERVASCVIAEHVELGGLTPRALDTPTTTQAAVCAARRPLARRG